MGYQSALEAAGANILEFWETGDYQGTWFALLEDKTIVSGSYGSCSGCDSFYAEFDYIDNDAPDYQERLAKFGWEYLDDVNARETLDELIERYGRKTKDEYAWDDDKDILEKLQEFKKKYS